MHSRTYAAVNARPTAMYQADQAMELTAQSAAVDDPTDREAALAPVEDMAEDAFGPEDAPTIMRPPFEPAADNTGGGVARPHTVGFGQPTLKLPIAALPVDLAQQAAVARAGRPAGSRGRIGKYELRERLARGAFGVVYTARDPSLDRDVAIKVLRPNHLRNPTIVQRFLQEARATARIAHPGIVTIHDCGQVETKQGPTAYIAMELLFGESLTARLARCGQLSTDDASEIGRQVASALDAAHRADVLHRDLKPDNIFLVPDPAIPSGERVKVLDFGLAKLGTADLTNVETVFGTPHYMSPEQCRSATQIDHRADIYSLGCILFELVTGRVPFEGEVRELIEFHQYAAPPLASSLAPDISPSLDVLIAEMLAKDPMHRPQTMGAVRRALQRGDSEPLRLPTAPSAPFALPLQDPAVRSPESVRAASEPHGDLAQAVPMAVLEGAMSGELIVPPSGARSAVAPLARGAVASSGTRRVAVGSGPRGTVAPGSAVAPARPPAPMVAARWQRLSSRARLVGFGLTVALVSALIAWASTS